MRKILQSIEEQAGRKMQTPKDFQWLSDEIFRRLHQTLSPSTLKRLWGYFPSVRQPHPYTIDLLTRYAESLSQCMLTKGGASCYGMRRPSFVWCRPRG